MEIDSFIKRFEKAEEIFNSEVNRLTTSIFKNCVIPFCNKYNLEFDSGMGACFFSKPKTTGTQSFIDEDDFDYAFPDVKHDSEFYKEWVDIWKLLRLSTSQENFEIGTQMNDYKPNKKKVS